MKNKNYTLHTSQFVLPVLLAVLFISSCKKEPEEVEENDVITTVKLSVKDTASALPAVDYFFRDLDGEGGNNPVTDTFVLQANTYYEIELDLTNERQSPPQSVTEEIMDNKEEHAIIFQAHSYFRAAEFHVQRF